MDKKVFGLLIILIPAISQAQLGGLLKKAKSKVEQRIENKVDSEMDKKLDQAEGKQTASSAGNTVSTSSTSSEQPKAEKETLKSYSKFDFIPGEKVIYAEDFAQDAIGELPLTWNSSGKGEVQTIEGKQGKWLRGFENVFYLTGNRKSFGENYTVEFDHIFYFEPKVKGYVLPYWKAGLMSSGGMDPADNSFLRDQSEYNSTQITFSPGSNGAAFVESEAKRKPSFKSNRMSLGDLTPFFNQVVHYSIQVQKTRFRMWINDKKVFDIPRAMIVGDTMNQLYFYLENSNYQEDEIGLFISNIKVATGVPDTRHKLIEEGKFSTTGILFDVNAATIKPESNGVLKELGGLLNEHKDVKIKIIGHTDSDGTDAANLELSKKRSEAVKTALATGYGIEESRIQTDGKGESVPVGDNKTKEGKAQNRRVEFVKI
ncbi:MAG TPA: OmpA family protein [Flavisolibacter sp.]|jgi:outer membrane protein OmpA-like peptidoglycan-associated protein